MSLQPTWKYSLKTLQSDRKRGRREAEASVKGQQREHGKEHKFNVAVKKTSPHPLPPTADTHSQDDASGQEGSRSLDLETQAVSSAPPPPTHSLFPNAAERKVWKATLSLRFDPAREEEESHQNPEVVGGEREGGESELKKTAKLKGLRRGVRHAEDKFLEPLQGIWSYACRSDAAGRERRKYKQWEREKDREIRCGWTVWKEKLRMEEGQRWEKEQWIKRRGREITETNKVKLWSSSYPRSDTVLLYRLVHEPERHHLTWQIKNKMSYCLVCPEWISAEVWLTVYAVNAAKNLWQ